MVNVRVILEKVIRSRVLRILETSRALTAESGNVQTSLDTYIELLPVVQLTFYSAFASMLIATCLSMTLNVNIKVFLKGNTLQLMCRNGYSSDTARDVNC